MAHSGTHICNIPKMIDLGQMPAHKTCKSAPESERHTQIYNPFNAELIDLGTRLTVSILHFTAAAVLLALTVSICHWAPSSSCSWCGSLVDPSKRIIVAYHTHGEEAMHSTSPPPPTICAPTPELGARRRSPGGRRDARWFFVSTTFDFTRMSHHVFHYKMLYFKESFEEI